MLRIPDPAAFIAGLSPAEKAALDQVLGPELATIRWNWLAHARANQLPPAGDWLTWLVLAGRGFGKTRCGAEWVRAQVTSGRATRIALIAETQKDLEEVMVFGQSGLLSVFPPHQKPRITKKPIRIEFHTGAVANGYNATEPDQLRGPQFDLAWCIAGDVAVTMSDGNCKKISDIRIGDHVVTRYNKASRVLASGMTRRNAETLDINTSSGLTLTATDNHKVWTSRGWIPAGELQNGDILCPVRASIFSEIRTPVRSGMLDTRQSHCTFGCDIISRPRKFIGHAITSAIVITGFVNFLSEAKDRLSNYWRVLRPTLIGASASVIGSQSFASRATISSIRPPAGRESSTPSKIPERECRPQPKGVARFISAISRREIRREPVSARQSHCAMPSMQNVSHVQAGSKAKHLEIPAHSALANAWKSIAILGHSIRNIAYAIISRVENNISPLNQSNCFVLSTVGIAHIFATKPHQEQSLALPAASNSNLKDLMQNSAEEHALCDSTMIVVSVSKSAQRRDVYDITVEDGEFFANGILVHNCDEMAKWRYTRETWDQLQFGLRLGNHPRQIITTTPRPIPVLKEILAAPTTVMSRGVTLDNQANLAASFIKSITDKYAGTRLGRQELNAEILDDIPDALWTRAALDRDRIKLSQLPVLKRVVVAIDPAAKKNEMPEDGAATGIVVAAVGEDNRGYVLDDATCRGTPNEWARMAVACYDRYEGNCIVGEINNGGEMVAATVRAVRPTVPFKEVHASKGKWTRAEPVAALYEQGRISHVGTFAALEDEMVNFGPNGMVGEISPDRVDALVWAFSELFPTITKKIVEKKVLPRTPVMPYGDRSGDGWMAS